MATPVRKVDRRSFCKVSAASTVGLSILGAGGAAASAVAPIGKTKSMSTESSLMHSVNLKVEVNHEWGILKEVVCGIPYFRMPTKLPKAVYNYAPTEGIKFYEANLGKSFEEADSKLFEKAREQMEAAVGILEKRGVKVHRPKQCTDDEQNYLAEIFPASVIQFYPRDPMIVIGNRFIETGQFYPFRRRERFGIRRALADRLAKSDAQLVSMPPETPKPEAEDGSWGPGPFLEGGDTFMLGRNIYVGVSGNASNSAGVKWLRQYLGEEYKVHEIKLTKKFLHLDCCLATPREGLAIICKEAFVDGLPSFLNDWELIELPYHEAKEMLGCNGLVLDEKTIVIHTDLPKLSEALRKAGQEVIETPFDAVYQFAGAFRCWHHPLVRESKLD